MIYLRDIDPGYKEGHKYFIIIKGELVDITNEGLQNISGELFYGTHPIEQILRAERELNDILPITDENGHLFNDAWFYSNIRDRGISITFAFCKKKGGDSDKIELTNGWWYWKDTLLYYNAERDYYAKAFSGELVYESKPPEMIKTVLLDGDVEYEGGEHAVHNWLTSNVGQSQYYNKKFTVTQKTQKNVCSSLHL